MSKPVKPIPDGFHSLTPYLVVKNAAKAIDFYKEAFGAEEIYRSCVHGTDQVMNAQLRIGSSLLMLNDEFPDFGSFGPSDERPSSVTIHIFVEDVDTVFAQAVNAGAEVTMPVDNMFWGDRYGSLKDPFGHRWSIGTRIEDVPPDEMAERAKHAFA